MTVFAEQDPLTSGTVDELDSKPGRISSEHDAHVDQIRSILNGNDEVESGRKKNG